MNERIFAAILVAIFCFHSCASPGSSASSPSVQGAQTLTGQQGQVGETGAATTNGSPIFAIIMAASKVSLNTTPNGGTEMEVTGSDNATVTVSGPIFGESGVVYGDNAMSSSTSSGGGGVAGAEGGVTGGGGQQGAPTTTGTVTTTTEPGGGGQ